MSELKPGLSERLEEVRSNVERALHEAGREKDAALLIAVSKTFPISACEAAWDLGVREFGENYVQEGVEKIRHFKEAHPEDPGTWHFIGPLQTNKTKAVAEHFDWMHSLDRLKVARRLSEQRPADMPPLNVLIEVNVDGEASKSGVKPDEVADFARDILALPGLRLRGLMTIPAKREKAEEKHLPFRALRRLFEELKATAPDIDTLSMGMSADMREAVAEGATMVRVGSAIFGPRDYGKR